MSAPHQAISVDQMLALQQQIVRLEALLEASRQIHSTIELDEVLRQTLATCSFSVLNASSVCQAAGRHDCVGTDTAMTKQSEAAVAQANCIELSLPSRLGYEKVAMNTAASVARLMGFSEDRCRRGLYQLHRTRQ